MKAVDVKVYDDYLNFVSEPMDLGKVQDKLSMLEYPDASSFAADVRLVFSNCRVRCLARCNTIDVQAKHLRRYTFRD